jgi:hypothetical protein
MTVEKKFKKNYGVRTFIYGGITFLNCVKTVFPSALTSLLLIIVFILQSKVFHCKF